MNIVKIKENFNYFTKQHKDLNLFLIRDDGHTLIRSHEKDEHHLAVLISSMWNASHAASKIFDHYSLDQYRLGFDCGDKGLFILPIKKNDKVILLGCVFKNALQTGKLKQEIRNLANEIGEYFEDESQDRYEDFIFKDLSDEEIDQVFAAIRI